MKNVYLYDPSICDGDYCPMNCDRCTKADLILEKMETLADEVNPTLRIMRMMNDK